MAAGDALGKRCAAKMTLVNAGSSIKSSANVGPKRRALVSKYIKRMRDLSHASAGSLYG